MTSAEDRMITETDSLPSADSNRALRGVSFGWAASSKHTVSTDWQHGHTIGQGQTETFDGWLLTGNKTTGTVLSKNNALTQRRWCYV